MCNKLTLPFTILRKAYRRMFSYEVINRFTKGSGLNRYVDYDEAWKESLTFETATHLKAGWKLQSINES